MKTYLLIISMITALLVGCGHQDPIDSFVKQASVDRLFPATGTFIIPIQLPATAPVSVVVSRALSLADTNLTILETRQVHIANADKDRLVPPDALRYTAVLVDTGSGKKVVFLQFQRTGSWIYRVYDIQPST